MFTGHVHADEIGLKLCEDRKDTGTEPKNHPTRNPHIDEAVEVEINKLKDILKYQILRIGLQYPGW